MERTVNIGFVGGGRMAEALIKGILAAELLQPQQIVAADPDPERRQFLQSTFAITVYEESARVWQECTVIILAVKPQLVGRVLDQSRAQVTAGHLVISIAAGIPLSFIEGKLPGGCRVIRVMPNTPAIVQESASALCGGRSITPADLEFGVRIFEAVGTCAVVEEGLLDAVTGLSGSGPAYVFSFLEGLIDAGLKVGLSRPVATELVLQTVFGSVKLAMESGTPPAELRAMVTSPGGTTIAGLHQMEKAGFRGILMDMVEAAAKRSRELGAAFPTPGE